MDIQMPLPAGVEEILYSHDERGVYDYLHLRHVLARARAELGIVFTGLESREDIATLLTEITVEDISQGEVHEGTSDGRGTFICDTCGGAFLNQPADDRKNSLRFLRGNYQRWFKSARRKMKSGPRTLIVRMRVYGYLDTITVTAEGCLNPETGRND